MVRGDEENQQLDDVKDEEFKKVDFDKKIDVNEGDRKGNVEKWLLEIEK